ncbi:MAG: hypothetical protein OER85_20375 [Gammaproteobacteria bacterium]|nr:hypothetical protein [Gammaproteobacteria bacterium]
MTQIAFLHPPPLWNDDDLQRKLDGEHHNRAQPVVRVNRCA